MLDATGAQALGEIVAELEARHITVLIKRPRPEHLRTLRAVGSSTVSPTNATSSTTSTTPSTTLVSTSNAPYHEPKHAP